MKQQLRRLTIAALGAALVCIATSLIKIPIPLGYAHLGNCMILLFGVLFDPWVGAIAGGVGSALSDLLGYPEWALPTLIIKSLMGLCVALISKKKGEHPNIRSLRVFLAALAGIVVMILGYFIAGSILYGSVITGATQIPGLTLEGVVGIVVFYILAFAIQRAKAFHSARTEP